MCWSAKSFIGKGGCQPGKKKKRRNAQSNSLYPTLCNPMDHSPTGSTVIGILQARILEWLPCSPPGDLPDPGIEPIPCVSCITGSFFTAETLGKSKTESCFIWQTFWGLQAGETGVLGCSRGLLQEGKQGSQIYRRFCNEDQVAETLKITVN